MNATTVVQETITVYELSQASGLSAEQLHELVEYAALHPVQPNAMVFSTACIVPLRTACALQADYDLDLFTVGMLVGYLFRIESLERQVQTLRAHLPIQTFHEGNKSNKAGNGDFNISKQPGKSSQ